MWTVPQFRQRGGGLDWMQMADMVIPGNIWDSRADRFRPLGIVQGVTGLPVDTANELYNRFGSGVGEAFRSGGNMLSNLRNRFRTSRDARTTRATANMPPTPWGSQGYESEDAYYRNWDQSGNPNVQRITGTDLRMGRLGMGALGSASLANQLYYENAMRNRGGALMER